MKALFDNENMFDNENIFPTDAESVNNEIILNSDVNDSIDNPQNTNSIQNDDCYHNQKPPKIKDFVEYKTLESMIFKRLKRAGEVSGKYSN